MNIRPPKLQNSEIGDSFASGAEFSECRRYRYALWRRWDWQGYAKQVMFIGLNPSTADETKNDATIRRCIQFARDWGFCGVIITNAYAWCCTNPKKLKSVSDPIGPDNDDVINRFQSQAGLIIAAWGTHCPLEREDQICQAIAQGQSDPLTRTLHCLGRTKAGRPRHPLYLPKHSQLEVFWPS